MGTAAATKQIYHKGVLAMKVVLELLAQHNQGVKDDHIICAKLDADATVGDTDYEAQLTAKEIPYEGYTPTETAVNRLPHPVDLLSEAVLTDLVEQINARITDLRTITAKLDADAGVADADYSDEATAKRITALGETYTSAADLAALFEGAGSGGAGKVLQAMIEQHNTLAQDWHNVCAKLDADAGVTDADYEAQLSQKTISQF